MEVWKWLRVSAAELIPAAVCLAGCGRVGVRSPARSLPVEILADVELFVIAAQQALNSFCVVCLRSGGTLPAVPSGPRSEVRNPAACLSASNGRSVFCAEHQQRT